MVEQAKGGVLLITEAHRLERYPAVVTELERYLTERAGHFRITTAKGTLVGDYNGSGTPMGAGRLKTTAVVRDRIVGRGRWRSASRPDASSSISSHWYAAVGLKSGPGMRCTSGYSGGDAST